MNKLPYTVRRVVSRKVPEAETNLDSLMTFVDEKTGACEKTCSVAALSTPVKKVHLATDGQPPAVSLFTNGSAIPASTVTRTTSQSCARQYYTVDVETEATARKDSQVFSLLQEISHGT